MKTIISKLSIFLNSHKIKDIYLKQYLLAGLFILLIIIIILVIGFVINSQNNNVIDKSQKIEPIKIEVAEAALDGEKMWRNHFEDRLAESDNIMREQIDKIKGSLQLESKELRAQNKDEITELKQQLLSAQSDLREALQEIIEMKNQQQETLANPNQLSERHISLINISDEPNIVSRKDSQIYIPETSYVSGFLMGGMAVSTSIGSSSAPIPVAIRITDRGNLPKNFNINLKNCRILGSGYGDLSSERAVIRVETMVCNTQNSDEVITTKIAGIIYGDDGMNGIKGHVVDMSSKHIRNAAVGGILSGFASTMKTEGQFALGAFGPIQTKQDNIGDKLRNNSLSGIGNSAEKIADYYIKQAENMSPILVIPGGTKVDVLFTKGVYLGSVDIVKKINNEMR
jgi:hypothetical protein